jgi:hypothetical protein
VSAERIERLRGRIDVRMLPAGREEQHIRGRAIDTAIRIVDRPETERVGIVRDSGAWELVVPEANALRVVKAELHTRLRRYEPRMDLLDEAEALGCALLATGTMAIEELGANEQNMTVRYFTELVREGIYHRNCGVPPTLQLHVPSDVLDEWRLDHASWHALPVMDVPPAEPSPPPDIVRAITIEGSVLLELYDEQPWYGFYSTQKSLGVDVPAPMTLTQAMDAALAAWQTVCGHDADGRHGEDEKYHGRFSASRIVLLDTSGDVVQQYDGKSWVTEFAPAEQWPELLARATSLDEEASMESGSDNFSTAQQLRDEAKQLRTQVTVARASLDAGVEVTLASGANERKAEPFAQDDAGRVASQSLSFEM